MGGYCNSSSLQDKLEEAANELKDKVDDMDLPSINLPSVPDIFQKKYQFNFQNKNAKEYKPLDLKIHDFCKPLCFMQFEEMMQFVEK